MVTRRFKILTALTGVASLLLLAGGVAGLAFGVASIVPETTTASSDGVHRAQAEAGDSWWIGIRRPIGATIEENVSVSSATLDGVALTPRPNRTMTFSGPTNETTSVVTFTTPSDGALVVRTDGTVTGGEIVLVRVDLVGSMLTMGLAVVSLIAGFLVAAIALVLFIVAVARSRRAPDAAPPETR